MPGVWRGMVCGVVKDVEGFWVSGDGEHHHHEVLVCFMCIMCGCVLITVFWWLCGVWGTRVSDSSAPRLWLQHNVQCCFKVC